MKFALTLALIIFSLKSFAVTGVDEGTQPRPRPARPAKPKMFTGPMNIQIHRQEKILSIAYSSSEEFQVDQQTKAMLDEKVGVLASQGMTVPVIWSRGSSSYGFSYNGQRVVDVHARGEIDGHLLSSVQSEITPNEVTSWRVDIYRGNNHLAGKEILEPEYITINMEEGRPVLRMHESFAANMVTDIKDYMKKWDWKYQPEKLRAALTPMKWEPVNRPTYPHEMDIHGSMRGVFTLTHQRVEDGRTIILSHEQTMELLHITRPTLLSRCLALFKIIAKSYYFGLY